MSGPVSIGSIDAGLSIAERLLESFYWNSKGAEAYDTYRHYKRSIADAQAEMRRLYAIWEDFRSFERSRAAEYDRFVTTRRDDGPEGCSCHINPPCSYCTREVDTDEEEARTQDNGSL